MTLKKTNPTSSQDLPATIKHWTLFLFVGIALLHILLEATVSSSLIYISKPLLMPALALFFYWSSSKVLKRWDRFFLAALFFSFGGDTLLLFVEQSQQSDLLFALGLGSFLIAHLCYILAFWSYPQRGIRLHPWIVVLLLLVSGALLFFIWPGIPNALRVPVLIYALTISFMGIFAYSMLDKVGTSIGMLFVYGAFLFILSDSLIAINKFKLEYAIWQPRLSIMLTYLLGQFLIILAAIKAHFLDTSTVSTSPN